MQSSDSDVDSAIPRTIVNRRQDRIINKINSSHFFDCESLHCLCSKQADCRVLNVGKSKAICPKTVCVSQQKTEH